MRGLWSTAPLVPVLPALEEDRTVQLKMSECTGHCCRSFFLPEPLNVIQTRRDEIQDGDIIADMVYFQGSFRDPKTGRVEHYYGCRHHDAESGRCTNYEGRPRMCSQYPYGKRCEFRDCTLGGVDAAPDVPVDRLLSRPKN